MYNEAKLLREKGHEVFFFATNKQPYFEKDYKYIEYFSQYVDFKSLKGIEKLKYLSIFYNFEAEKKLNLLIKEIQPDLAHIHNTAYYLTSSALKTCIKNNVPIVKTFHDFRYFCPGGTFMKNNKHCEKESCISGNPIKCINNRCKNNSLIDSIMVSAENLFNRSLKLDNNISRFIFPSQAMYDLALRAGFNKEKMLLINNFVDDMYLNIEPEYNNKGYFLYVGRLSPEKGIHYLIDAMSLLPGDIKLHIAGSGSEETNLKKLCEKYHLKNVKFLGVLSGKELIDQYSNCISTILPSICFESFGVTILEAFSCGKPVIASNAGALPELIEHNINGFLVESGNINHLKGSIEKLSGDNILVINMGKNARKKVERLYSSEIHISKLIEIYKQVFDKY